jgi:hypothetical protein
MLSSGGMMIFSFPFPIIISLNDNIGVIIWLDVKIYVIISLDESILLNIWGYHLGG